MRESSLVCSVRRWSSVGAARLRKFGEATAERGPDENSAGHCEEVRMLTMGRYLIENWTAVRRTEERRKWAEAVESREIEEFEENKMKEEIEREDEENQNSMGEMDEDQRQCQ